MKKTYRSPKTEVRVMQTQQILTVSGDQVFNSSADGNRDVLSRSRNGGGTFEDDGLW